jgi:hypothetical protein
MFWKLACASRAPLSYTSEKSCTPRIAKMRMTSIMREPTFAMAGIAITKVLKEVFNPRFYLNKVKMRAIRNDLITVVCGPKFILVY